MKAYLLILFAPLTLLSQTFKTYNGTFEKGKATYQYSEKENGERVYQGKFHYECEDIGNNYPFQTIDGNYVNGEKTGKWIYIYESRQKNFVSTIKKSTIYNNSKQNGEYFEEQSFVETKDGKTEKKINKRKTINYIDGKPYGKFTIESIYPLPSIYKGFIDSLGFADGIWNIKDELVKDLTSDEKPQKFECTMEFKHGLVVRNKTISPETGKVLEDFTFSEVNLKDTTFCKPIEVVIPYITCADINYNSCQTNNHDLRDLMSKNIPFSFNTRSIEIVPTLYSKKLYKGINQDYANNKNAYLAALGNIYLSYSGSFKSITQKESSSPMTKHCQFDTSETFVNAANRAYEILYCQFTLQDVLAASLAKKNQNPINYVQYVVKNHVQENGLPEKFWKASDEKILFSKNLDYAFLFADASKLSPETFFDKIISYNNNLNQEIKSLLPVLSATINDIKEKDRAQRLQQGK